MKMWEGRFAGPAGLDPAFERWQRSFDFDRRLLPQELAASRAWARALAAAGVLSEAERQAILAGLDQVEDKARREPAFLESAEAEDVHHFVELRLVEAAGEAGYKLHTGRSRNEQIAADLRLFARDRLDAIRARLLEWLGALLERAGELRDAAMPAYTHLQRAEPILASHWLLAYAEMFFRDAGRLGDCRRRLNVSPLGSGAVAGATVAMERATIARELGFESVSGNSLDATSDRDFALEFIHALTFIALHLGRWAEDVLLYSTLEFGFVRLSDRFVTGSSALPQKKNPDALELLRAQLGRVAGAAASLLLTLKALPLGYDKDLQESQQPLYAAADTVAEALPIATGVLRTLEFDRARMEKAARAGFLNATAAANYLVRRGVPFRRAHAAVGQAVQLCLEKGCELEALAPADWQRIHPEFGADVKQRLTLEAVLAGHDVAGGTAPARVEAALGEARQRLEALRKQTHANP